MNRERMANAIVSLRAQAEGETTWIQWVVDELRREPIGTDLAETWLSRRGAHALAANCPRCGVRVMNVGITALLYSFEVCSCGTPEYDHLVETLWHRDCFTGGDAGPVVRHARNLIGNTTPSARRHQGRWARKSMDELEEALTAFDAKETELEQNDAETACWQRRIEEGST